MKIAILGYGTEGKSAEAYFQKHHHDIKVFDNFQTDELAKFDLNDFDLILRSPSVPPLQDWSSSTQYFFAHCPCPIIGVTGTKGKGTTCSIITAILKQLEHHVWLVGNIGNPALDVLDEIQPDDVVVYEMSSFQLWDLKKSPQVAVVLRIEPDHLNVHKDFSDYVNAKGNIARFQTPDEACIYYAGNNSSRQIAALSAGQKISFPISEHREALDAVLDALSVPGNHNREDAEAAVLAVAAHFHADLTDFLQKYDEEIKTALHDFQGLPHRLQFLRELNHVRYYDDNFSSSFPALDVALAAFPDQPIILIAGGKDRGIDPAPAKDRIFNLPNLEKAFLIGETKTILAKDIDQSKYELCESLPEAFMKAQELAENIAKNSDADVIVLMSPGAPSFDMFKNFADRGKQFQKLVQELK